MQSHFRVQVHNEDRSTVITVAGELDLASSAALEEELVRVIDSEEVDRLIVDLRQLEFMDSTGLSTLVKAHHRAEEAGTTFALVRGSQQVQRLLTLTGVAERLELADAPEELMH